MSNNQLKHQRADWAKFRADILRGAKPKITALHVDDLRRIIMQLNFHFAGKHSDEAIQLSASTISWSPDNQEVLKAGQGDIEFSTFDTSHGMTHIEMVEEESTGQQIPTAVAGRWIRWKNNQHLYANTIGCDGEWDGITDFYIDDIIYYRGALFQVTAASTTAVPRTVTKISPNVQYSDVHADYTLVCELAPCCYYNAETERLETKIHFDTWIKNKDGGYSEDDCVSWQGGWQAQRNIILTAVEPHEWDGDTWSAQIWPKGKLVLDADGITVWEALKVTDTNSPAENEFWTEREDLAIEWIKLASSYNLSSTYFELSPSNNYLHDWSRNFPGNVRYYDKQIDEGGSVVADDEIDCHPSEFFPTQVDPAEVNEWIIRAYKETTFTTLSGQREPLFGKNKKINVKLNSKHFTDPDTLGAVFDANRWRSSEKTGGGYNYFRIGYTSTAGLDFPGNQYTHFGGDVWRNCPMTTGNWRRNPKKPGGENAGALQNHAEIILSDSAIRLPFTETYKANWCRRYYTDPAVPPVTNTVYYDSSTGGLKKYNGTAWVTVEPEYQSGWHSHPSISDESWGENEAGIEQLLATRAEYDWVFQFGNEYIPEGICYEAERTYRGVYGKTPAPELATPTAEECLTQWLCRKDGTWRRTFHYSLGRKPFMRSIEMLEPAHRKDTFTPGVAEIDGITWTCKTSPGLPAQWLGAYTINTPLISDFDNEFLEIAPAVYGVAWAVNQAYIAGIAVQHEGVVYYTKQKITDVTNPPASNSQYAPVKLHLCEVAGNYVNNNEDNPYDVNLRRGWMVHLCKTTNQAISQDTNEVRPAYILDLKYDSINDKTIITLSETLDYVDGETTDTFDYIGINRNISRRHDGYGAKYSFGDDSTIDYEILYECKPEMLIELYDLLNLAKYKEIAPPNLSTKCLNCSSGYTNSAGGSVAAAWSTALSLVKTAAAIMDDPDNWPTEEDFSSDSGNILRTWRRVVIASKDIFTQCEASEYHTYNPNLNPPRWIHTSNGGAGCQIFAFKLSNWEPPLKELPDKILIRFSFWVIRKSNTADWPLSGVQNNFTQKCGGLTNRLSDDYFVNEQYYGWMWGEISKGWHICKPEYWGSTHWQTENEKLFETDDYGINWGCVQGMGSFDCEVSPTVKPVIIIDLETVAEDFYNDAFYHVDAPRDLRDDTAPPRPKPIHQFNPYTALKYILPYDLEPDEDEDGMPDVDGWDEGAYSEGDKVYVILNQHKHLFTAKNNIASSTIPPINDPDNWEWIEPYVELHLYATSCIVKDYEQSNPVKYRLVCAEDGSLTTEYLQSREKDLTLSTIQLPIGTISGTTSDQSGLTRLTVTGSYAVDDVIEIIGTSTHDGVYPVEAVGSGTVDIDFGGYVEETFGDGCYVINRTQTYTEADWDSEDFAEYTFAFQAKDSAADVQGMPQDNETSIGRGIQIIAPADYINYFDD